MIAIADTSGTLIRIVPANAGETLGFHELFGFVSSEAAARRMRHRERRGLKADRSSWRCRFRINRSGNTLEIEALEGCKARTSNDGSWTLVTAFGSFRLSPAAESAGSAVAISDKRIGSAYAPSRDSRENKIIWGAMAALFLILMIWTRFSDHSAPVAEEIPEPITVNIVQEKTVVVPKLHYATPEHQVSPQVAQDRQVRRAVQQDLGFLGLLGKKNLKGALGGMPTDLKDVSPGAGAGGKEGSGGEALVGLGQGVKRVTVGNTGVAGLGGVGTKGRGGGAGGYGNSMVGSGEGKGLTSVPLSEDLTLEGGLDRSAIQATIARYLNQVRACYEAGLRSNPGISGQVLMDFEIGGTGKLNYARVGKSSLGNAGVEQCISQKMMNWQFPKPLGGVNVKVKYPFLLRPVGV